MDIRLAVLGNQPDGPEGSNSKHAKMKTWRQKQTGQIEVFLIRAVLSEDEVTIEYHEVTTKL